MRGYLDGHFVLSRAIAARGRFPAVDVLQSVSRLMPEVARPEHLECATRLRELLAHYEENRDLVQVGAYRHGADPLLDRALSKIAALEGLLYQGGEPRSAADTLLTMRQILLDSTNPHVMADR
jgi:flagellar biosynthesis/type III secretory pathway ATPase